MNTQSITKKEFLYWMTHISEKGFSIKSETSSFNKNDTLYYVASLESSEKTYILSKYKNGVGKTFYYKNIDVIGGMG